jgi:hypothetical protein
MLSFGKYSGHPDHFLEVQRIINMGLLSCEKPVTASVLVARCDDMSDGIEQLYSIVTEPVWTNSFSGSK